MKNQKQINSLKDNIISDDELNKVIGDNKDIYKKLNELPEIEALDSIINQEESIDGIDKGKKFNIINAIETSLFLKPNCIKRK